MPQPRRRRAHRAQQERRLASAPLRVAAGVAAAGAVVLTVSGGALVGPAKQEAAATAHRDLVAQQVAQVWRSAGSVTGTAAGEQPASGTAPSADVVALQAEVLSERGGSASRSEDRLAAAQSAAGAQSAEPGQQDEPQQPQQSADASDPVAQAQQQVQQLVVQDAADAADAEHAARAAEAPAGQAREAVAAAQAQRAAQEAAAQLAAAQADPRAVAVPLAAQHGWGAEQFSCLDRLWTRESGWSWSADNPTSDAYGIPQSLPGDKMASHGAGWRTDPRVQIAWGLDYIASSYGTPCGAWAHSQSTGWY